MMSLLLPPFLICCPQGVGEGPERTVLAEPAVRIPMELAGSRPVPVVEARVQGQGPFRFILDTGASVIVLDSAFAERMGLASEGEIGVGDPSSSARIPARLHRLESIELGPARFEGVPCLSFDRSTYDVGEDLQGILGLPLFADLLLTLDFPNLEIELARGALPEAGGDVLDYDDSEPLPLLRLRVDGVELPAHLDSGSASFLVLPGTPPDGIGFRDAPQVIGRGRTVNSEFEVLGGRLNGSLWIGDHEFDSPQVRQVAIFPVAILGHECLRLFAITLDQRHNRIRFRRAEDPALRLERLLGTWQVQGRAWVMPDAAPLELAGSATLAKVHGGRWIREEFDLSPVGDGREGEILLGWSIGAHQYQAVQVDAYNPSMVHLTGSWNAEREILVLEQSSGSGVPLRWEYAFAPEGGFVRQELRRNADGAWWLAAEFRYTPAGR